jgi:hypothetical protein
MKDADSVIDLRFEDDRVEQRLMEESVSLGSSSEGENQVAFVNQRFSQSGRDYRMKIVAWMELPGNIKIIRERGKVRSSVFPSLAMILGCSTRTARSRYDRYLENYQQAKVGVTFLCTLGYDGQS